MGAVPVPACERGWDEWVGVGGWGLGAGRQLTGTGFAADMARCDEVGLGAGEILALHLGC